MKGNMEERACQLALYIIENKATVRAAAQKFKISKSTVHKDAGVIIGISQRECKKALILTGSGDCLG